MDDILDDLNKIVRQCRRAAALLDEAEVVSTLDRLNEAAKEIAAAASGGWLGYHAVVYIEDFRARGPSDYFDTEWGSEGRYANRTQGGPWVIYDRVAVLAEIHRRAGDPDKSSVERTTAKIQSVFDEAHDELLPTIDALLFSQDDPTIRRVRADVEQLKSFDSELDFRSALVAGRQFGTRDPRAAAEGIKTPPHMEVVIWIGSQRSRKTKILELAKQADHLARYCEKTQKMRGRTVARTSGKIFIGHGRSNVWKDLKDFLQDRLGLLWDEFNREATAGLSTKERLETMMDEATFAFLVMTAEDEHSDATRHARENVIHEAGLFQGRLGFTRAIVLLENGCKEFSNIVGLGQIRFPAGDLASKFEEIRRVLEREKLI